MPGTGTEPDPAEARQLEMGRLTRRAVRRAVLVLAAGTALTAAWLASPPAAANARTTPALSELGGPAALRNRFNDDRGHVRLVLLLSPT